MMLLGNANVFAIDVNKDIDTIGVDRFAHAGCSYVIANELHKAGMNKFWAGFIMEQPRNDG